MTRGLVNALRRRFTTEEERVHGIIQDVRITVLCNDAQKDNGVAGAVVGGLVADPVGAVVGYAADADKSVLAVRELEACKIIAKINDGALVEFNMNEHSGSAIGIGSTQRNGDKLNILKISGGNEVSYRWLYGNGPWDSIEGHALP